MLFNSAYIDINRISILLSKLVFPLQMNQLDFPAVVAAA